MSSNLVFVFWLGLCLLTSILSTNTSPQEIYERVGAYLKNYEQSTKQDSRYSQTFLANSNKIGLGYNPLYGSPVCYTGACQMEGFGHPVFKLDYNSPSHGACTNALVPDFVNVDCLPGIVTTANTEVISSLKQLSESISKRVDVSIGLNYNAFSFGYSSSKETTYMVNHIVQQDLVLLYTTAEVSQIKLSMFEPLMQLSDPFRYVIENLPCCDNGENDPVTDKYIRDYIFNYFGYTYVSTLMLGGLAQENIFLGRSSYEKLIARGISTMNAAKVAFYLSVGLSTSDTQSYSDYQVLMREIQNSYGTKLGGDPSKVNLHDWVKTIPLSPVVIKFGIRDIFNLLTTSRFPNDLKIQSKARVIEKVLNKYLQRPLSCYNNCTSSTRGRCIASGYFQFGMCYCNYGYTGMDCSLRDTTPKPSLDYGTVLTGTLCGYDRSHVRVNCNGLRPWDGCPSGWLKRTWVGADFTVCYKTLTSTNTTSISGTLCGLYNSGGSHYASIPCNNMVGTTCPSSSQTPYQLHTSSFKYGTTSCSTNFCFKASSGINYPDLPGTLCGIQWEGTNDGPMCGGYNPGLSKCPFGYQLYHWTLETGKRFALCAKL